MAYGLDGKKEEPSPFSRMDGFLVCYNVPSGGTIYGVYHEKSDSKGMYWMEFDPSLIQKPNGYAEVIRNTPTVTTNFSGTMRPLTNSSIEHLAGEINKNIEEHKDKRG